MQKFRMKADTMQTLTHYFFCRSNLLLSISLFLGLSLAFPLQAQTQQKSPPKQKKIDSSSPATSKGMGAGSSPDYSANRNVIHTDAYKKREYLGEHINFKITPPEKRGRPGHVLVEVYNYSKTYLSVVDFWLILKNSWGDLIEVHVTCDDIKPGWSALRWVKVETNKPLPAITNVEIRNMVIYNEKAQKINLRYYTDLIKG